MKSIFLVGPIGDDGSETRRVADAFKNDIVSPAVVSAFGENQATLTRADGISEPGRISYQILERLAKADVVIADLTDLNPNVMYELGVRQALLKPYVLLKPVGSVLPFDITDMRAIDYDFTLSGGNAAKCRLTEMLRAAGQSETPTDSLLFGPSRGTKENGEPSLPGILAQILDALTTLLQQTSNVAGGVWYLTQQEERQRADIAQYRQQEFGIKAMEVLSSQPSLLASLIREFAGLQSMQQPVENVVVAAPERPAEKSPSRSRPRPKGARESAAPARKSNSQV